VEGGRERVVAAAAVVMVVAAEVEVG